MKVTAPVKGMRQLVLSVYSRSSAKAFPDRPFCLSGNLISPFRRGLDGRATD